MHPRCARTPPLIPPKHGSGSHGAALATLWDGHARLRGRLSPTTGPALAPAPASASAAATCAVRALAAVRGHAKMAGWPWPTQVATGAALTAPRDQSEDTERSSLLRRPMDTANTRTAPKARATAGRSAGLARRTKTSHTTECSSNAMAAMRKRAETGKVSSPGHAKDPTSRRPGGSWRGGSRRPIKPPAWNCPRAGWPGPAHQDNRMAVVARVGGVDARSASGDTRTAPRRLAGAEVAVLTGRLQGASAPTEVARSDPLPPWNRSLSPRTGVSGVEVARSAPAAAANVRQRPRRRDEAEPRGA